MNKPRQLANSLAAACITLLLLGCSNAPERFGEGFGEGWQPGKIDIVWAQNIGTTELGFSMSRVQDSICVADTAGVLHLLKLASGASSSRVDLNTPLFAAGECTSNNFVGLAENYMVQNFDPVSGETRWELSLGGTLLAPPLALTHDIMLLFHADGLISAHSITAGIELWRLQVAASQFRLASTFTTIVEDDVVYFGMPNGTLYALNYLDGFILWQDSLYQIRDAGESTANLSTIGGIIVAGDRLCASAFNGKFKCYDKRNGRVAWTSLVSSSGTLAVSDDTLYLVDTTGALTAIALSNGETLWRVSEASANRATHVIQLGNRIVLDNGFGGLSIHDVNDGQVLGGLALAGKIIATLQIESDLIVLTSSGEIMRLTITD